MAAWQRLNNGWSNNWGGVAVVELRLGWWLGLGQQRLGVGLGVGLRLGLGRLRCGDSSWRCGDLASMGNGLGSLASLELLVGVGRAVGGAIRGGAIHGASLVNVDRGDRCRRVRGTAR